MADANRLGFKNCPYRFGEAYDSPIGTRPACSGIGRMSGLEGISGFCLGCVQYKENVRASLPEEPSPRKPSQAA